MGTPKPGILMGTRLYTEPGYLIQEIDGKRSQLAIADILRAADIPALTYAQVGAVKTLANVGMVALKALIERDLIGDDLFGGYDLPALFETLRGMGGDFGEPDLTVT
jgi:hypothetical protein